MLQPGDLREERQVVLCGRGDVPAQRRRELGRAEDRAEIEEDIGEHDLLVAARVHPAGYLRLPLRQSLAPQRIRCHDVARAQRKPGLLETTRESAGQLGEKSIDAFALGGGMIGEDEAVVLIRVEQALAAAGRAHHQHGKRYGRPAPARLRHAHKRLTQDGRCNVVVEGIDERDHLHHRLAGRQQHRS